MKVNAELLQHCSKMKIVGRAGVGVDNIDVSEATRHGIMVMNTPGGNTVSTAQLAMSLLCSLARKIPQGECVETPPIGSDVEVANAPLVLCHDVFTFDAAADASVKSGKWDRKSFTGEDRTLAWAILSR